MIWVLVAVFTLVFAGVLWTGWQLRTAPYGYEDERGFHRLGPQFPDEWSKRAVATKAMFDGLTVLKAQWLEDEFMPRLSNEVPVTFNWTWPRCPVA